MLTGCAPFGGATDAEILAKVKRGVYSIETLEDANVSPLCQSFIKKLLTKDVNQRISAVQALEDPWIA